MSPPLLSRQSICTPFHPFGPKRFFPHPFKSKNQARHLSEAPKCDTTALRSPAPPVCRIFAMDTQRSLQMARNDGNSDRLDIQPVCSTPRQFRPVSTLTIGCGVE
ncbi:hypothetical protein AVEN_52962-1 [Araneus ventricosus]|uniref:Uncharacterized protein n=1 Tax=Araneus ventricosus TaxID=182803 RepID=A0A4Y2JM60_ARAVE|nr:hypothetical protein AVEN_52962-1 [Araneus ventricosus]